MIAEKYNVVCHGEVRSELNKDQVEKNLCKLFKIPLEKVRDSFFSGSAVVVKKNVDHDTAEKYITALEKAGVAADIEPADKKSGRDSSANNFTTSQNSAQPVQETATAAVSKCPKCGYQPETNRDPIVTVGECPACGIIVSKYLEAVVQKEQIESPESLRLRDQILSVLEMVATEEGVYVYPNFPAKNFENAIHACNLPTYEEILGLVDCTLLGSSKDCLIFGIKGIYFHNPKGTLPEYGMVTYADLSHRSIQVLENDVIDLGNNTCFDCTCSLYPVGRVCGLLEAVQPIIREVLFGEVIPEEVDEPDVESVPGSQIAENLPLKDLILDLLRNAMPQDGLCVSPDIPSKKYRNAVDACKISPSTLVLGLVDCTVFGSAKNALVFCEDGIYFRNGFETIPELGMVPYTEFKDREFVALNKHTLNLGNEENVGFSGSVCPVHKVVGLLEGIKGLLTGEVEKKKKPRGNLLSPRCPKCGNTQFEIGESGYSWGTGIATTLFFGPLAGHLAASAREGKTLFICKACGKNWKPSKQELNRMIAQIQNT